MRGFRGHGKVATVRTIQARLIARKDAALTIDILTAFGLFAVSAMLICYAFENRSPWFILGFSMACALGSLYGFLQGAWPFGLVEGIWTVVALPRWQRARRSLVNE